MDRLTFKDFEPWFLSGKPVVRFAGRDFEQSVDEYEEWLRELGRACDLKVAVLKLADPPGVVVQTSISEDITLVDPMIQVSKGQHPWMFCIYPKCRIRVSTPGMSCAPHGG